MISLLRPALLLALTIAAPYSLHAQTAPPPSQTPQNPPQLTFDVASIHLSQYGPHDRTHIVSDPANSRFTTINLPLRMLIRFAFNVPENQIIFASNPLLSQHFDIEAKSGPDTDAALKALPTAQARLAKDQMVQALLADRFALKSHRETRQLPIYLLSIAKNGQKLQPSAERTGSTFNTSRDHIDDKGISMPAFAEQLAVTVDRVVEDRTALTGRYDLVLRWQPDDAPASDTSGPSIYTAIEEQLGLKLEPSKGPVEVLVIDHIQPPSEN